MFCRVGILCCACICWMGLELSLTSTSHGHFGLTEKAYDDAAVGKWIYVNNKIRLPAGMSEQEALVWCHHTCVSIPQCNSFVFKKDISICYWTSYDRCAHPTQLIYNTTGVRTYDVRNGSLPQPITTCYSSCSSSNITNCWKCGRPNCRGPKCTDCAYYCWHQEIYNITNTTSVWLNPQLTQSLYIPCDNGWQMIFGYFNISQPPKFNVYPLLFTEPVILRLAVVYADSTVNYSYFDTFTYAEPNKISVGNYLGGEAGNYWEAPFLNLSVVFNSSCPLFYPTASTNCTPGSGINTNFIWLPGNKIGITDIQFWVIPNGMEWFDSGYVAMGTTAPPSG